jgi:hypothetical protein
MEEKNRQQDIKTRLGLSDVTLKDMAVDLVRGITRNIGSAGLSFSKPFGGESDTLSQEDFKTDAAKSVFKFVFGDTVLKSVEKRVVELEDIIKQSPTAKELGFDKFALPIAFGGMIGNVGLDLLPIGGGKKGIEQLVKETDPSKVVSLLQKVGFADEVVQEFAPKIAKTTSETEVVDIFENMKALNGVKFSADLQKVINTMKTKSPIEKLISGISGAEKVRKEVEQAYSVERGIRAGEAGAEFTKGEGQSGYFSALSKLKGRLVDDEKKVFDMVKLEQKDMDSLFNQIGSANTLSVFDKISTSNGLQKIFNGELPQTNQLKLLEEVFGSDLIKTLQSKRSGWKKFGDAVLDITNLPRSLMSSVDFSAVLRQAVIPTVTRPKMARDSMIEMFKSTFSQKNFDGWFKSLKETPEYQRMKDSGLYIAEPNKLAGGLAEREETFISTLAQKIPWVKVSERAYVSYLNKMRVDMFNQIANKFTKDGIGTPQNFKSLAEFVNSATGRGNLKKLENEAQWLNTAFFSPRLIKSRLDFLNPLWYAKQTPPVRKEAIKSFAQFVGTGVTVISAINMLAGDDIEVESDPRSSDFGKIRIGDVRMDTWGGFQQFVTLFSQMLTGERKSIGSGDIYELDPQKFPFQGRTDRMKDFVRSKLSPFVSSIVDLMEGENVVGEPTSVKQEIAESVVPLYLQDIGSVINELGAESILTVGVPGMFGVGTQFFEGNPQESPVQKRLREIKNTKSGRGSTAKDRLKEIKKK